MTTTTTLPDLDEQQRYECYTELQHRLPLVWEAMRLDRPRESAVVVPSISIERTTASTGSSPGSIPPPGSVQPVRPASFQCASSTPRSSCTTA